MGGAYKAPQSAAAAADTNVAPTESFQRTGGTAEAVDPAEAFLTAWLKQEPTPETLGEGVKQIAAETGFVAPEAPRQADPGDIQGWMLADGSGAGSMLGSLGQPPAQAAPERPNVDGWNLAG